ncbi:MAG: hypothetical protein ACYDBB_24430 [Armatimonadota bacterium]
MSTRWFPVLCLSLALGALAGPVPPTPDLTQSVEIKSTDIPMQMETLKPFLATDAADRLNVKWPEGMTEIDFILAIHGNDFSKFTGLWPFKMPTGDPSKITRADYLEVLKNHPGTLSYIQRFSQTPMPVVSEAFEPICIFIALYKGTGERKYLDLAVECLQSFCDATDAEVKKSPDKAPYPSAYWVWAYAYVALPIYELEGTPEFDQMMGMFGKCLARRAAAWPVAPEHGPQNRAIDPAFWYDIALNWGADQIPAEKAAQLKARADQVWKECNDYYDISEDDCWYSLGDYIVLTAWYRVRGVKWWDTPEHAMFWRQYAEQPANDGFWPMYGDGASAGKYLAGTLVGETAARYLRDGRYKWLARRAFWSGKDRITKLSAGIGYQNLQFLSLAYLMADDTVKEVPPSAGVTVTTRRFRELMPGSIRMKGEPWYTMHPEIVPSKIVLRAGPKESDQFMFIQAGQMADHGHPDYGQIIYYGGNQAPYLYNGAIRLDNWQEAHNMFTLRDPQMGKYWPGRWCGNFTTNDISVPVTGTTSDGSFVRLHIREYPSTTTTEELWKTVRAWRSNWTLEKAIGYNNWPVRLDRSVLFVNNKFSVVRDVTTWLLPAASQMGQNWTFGELGSCGANWLNVWAPKIMDGHYSYLTPKGGFYSPVETAPQDLLIWYAPSAEATLQIEKILGDRSTTDQYKKAHYNAPLRAWYTRTGEWKPDAPQAFTTVLYPHAPGTDATALAASIGMLQDTSGLTVLQVKDGTKILLVIMNSSGEAVTVGDLTTDGEAAIITLEGKKATHLSVWQAKKATYRGRTLLNEKKAKDVDRKMN